MRKSACFPALDAALALVSAAIALAIAITGDGEEVWPIWAAVGVGSATLVSSVLAGLRAAGAWDGATVVMAIASAVAARAGVPAAAPLCAATRALLSVVAVEAALGTRAVHLAEAVRGHPRRVTPRGGLRIRDNPQPANPTAAHTSWGYLFDGAVAKPPV